MTIRQYAYQHVGPSRGLSVGDIRPRGLSVSTHISTLALPVDYPARWPFPWTVRVIFATRTDISTHISTLALPADCPGDFRHDDYPPACISARWPFPRTIRRYFATGDFHPGLSASTHISTLALPADCPVIFATRTVRHAYQHWSDCPVIFATMTIRQYAYQHAGLPGDIDCPGDFRHEDCPPVRISARWPFPWTIRVIFATQDCPRDCPWVIFATTTVRQDAYQHAGPSRGLSGDFRHEDCPPVRISARWPFPWTIRGDFRHEDCPRVIFATRTVRGDFRHEDRPPARISARWPFPRTVR
ncbi:hypothetical protein Bca101_102129 [Brassica carinata]